MNKQIAILMGSESDMPIVQNAIDVLEKFGVPFVDPDLDTTSLRPPYTRAPATHAAGPVLREEHFLTIGCGTDRRLTLHIHCAMSCWKLPEKRRDSMNTRRGTVAKRNSTIDVSGGGQDMPVSTTHIMSFELDSVTVRVRFGEPPVIENGDELIVAGEMCGDVFEAYAYHNLTRRVRGHQSIVGYLVIGTVFPILGFWSLKTFPSAASGFGLMSMVVSGVFIAVGVYQLYHGLKVWAAQRLLA